MKSKFIPLILILIFLITFVIFFKGLKNSNIYTPDTNLKKEVPSFELKFFENFGVLNKVEHLEGDDSQLEKLYREASLYVSVSLFEGFGLTVLEAMASSCPVITSNINSLSEVSGDAAILINPEDVDKLSAKIVLLCTNKKIREKMIKKGLKRAKKFNWEKAAKLTNHIYLNVKDSSF